MRCAAGTREADETIHRTAFLDQEPGLTNQNGDWIRCRRFGRADMIGLLTCCCVGFTSACIDDSGPKNRCIHDEDCNPGRSCEQSVCRDVRDAAPSIPSVDAAELAAAVDQPGDDGTGASEGGIVAADASGEVRNFPIADVPAGWLYTRGAAIYVSDGTTERRWMGRGVKIDDLFLCGYNDQMAIDDTAGESTLFGVVTSLMTQWHPNFVRVALGMNSYAVVSWLGSSTYKSAMTNVIHALGGYPSTYVLVSLRSDTSMVTSDGRVCGSDDDAVCMPSNATDAVYRALVDTFHDAPYVLLGVASAPGGGSASDEKLYELMGHAVGVIRAEEDALGGPHHIVVVQGNDWGSRIGFYHDSPLPYDNVAYEYHGYPPEAGGNYGYTQPDIPVIIGEYGPAGSNTAFLNAFYLDLESKQIPSLAWSLSPYSNCAPDLVQVTNTPDLMPTPWGMAVRDYLLAH